MRTLSRLVLAGLAACGDDSAGTPPDATVDAVVTSCPAQTAMPLPPGRHTIFLNFDGATLSPGADDAPNNISSLVPTTVAFPPYMDGNPVRQGRIDLVVGYVQRSLAPYSVEIVTTRPASGPYDMMVFGGKPDLINYGPDWTAVTPLTCSPDPDNKVTLLFDQDLPALLQASTTLSNVGMMAGLAGSTQFNDCMTQETQNYDTQLLCTFGAMAPTYPEDNCGRTVQDEPYMLVQAFGCR